MCNADSDKRSLRLTTVKRFQWWGNWVIRAHKCGRALLTKSKIKELHATIAIGSVEDAILPWKREESSVASEF